MGRGGRSGLVVVVCLALAGWNDPAHAEEHARGLNQPVRLVPTRFMIGLGQHYGNGAMLDVRASFVGLYSATRAGPGWRPFVAFGTLSGLGSVAKPPPLFEQGKYRTWRAFLGPELRVGDSFVEERIEHPYDLYLSFSPLYFFESDSARSLPDTGPGVGLRVALGAAAPRNWPLQFMLEPKSCDGGSCGLGLIFLLFPETWELEYQRLDGVSRLGWVMGYTF